MSSTQQSSIADNIDDVMSTIKAMEYEFRSYTQTVHNFFQMHPALSLVDPPIVHSVKSRTKDLEHLRKKILRKTDLGRDINPENVFQEINDFAGVRVLHIHLEQLRQIDLVIRQRATQGEWIFAEHPKAYTWDPETKEYMESLGLHVHIKPSYYTSVHYVVKPRIDSPVSCEIQVRTLFEEVWGEVDHMINYPIPTANIACAEQLKVLAKLVGAGSRLVDSVFRTKDNES